MTSHKAPPAVAAATGPVLQRPGCQARSPATPSDDRGTGINAGGQHYYDVVHKND